MRSIEHEFTVGRSDWIRLVFLGDVHIGNITTNEDLIHKCVNRIDKDKTAYWVDLGDRCDFINTKDTRFELGALPKWVLNEFPDIVGACSYRYSEFFKPIANKCIATVSGNHEDAILKHQERDVYSEINRLLGIKSNLGVCGFVRLKFKRARKTIWTLDMFLHHGASGGRSVGSSANFLSNMAKGFDADIYAMGHTHKKVVYSDRVYGLNSVGNVEEKDRVFINVGSFMSGYVNADSSGYAEKRLLYPQAVGPVELWLHPDKHHIKMVM